MELVKTPADFRAACEAARQQGKTVGLVPTMGALHAGHTSLIDGAHAAGATFVAVTIFVNPLQFAEGEDLNKYPRPLEADLAQCKAHGADLVFAPDDPGVMYPKGFGTEVKVTTVSKPLEGEYRPSHFGGVTTVVTKLFNLAGPCIALFGRKDYQQWRIIDRLVTDLDMPIDVRGMPIVREPDGLALSSRNVYLSAEERKRALALSHGLGRARDAWQDGERDVQRLQAMAREPIEAAFDQIDYVAAVDPDTFAPPEEAPTRLVLLGAAQLGRTRVIDNVELS